MDAPRQRLSDTDAHTRACDHLEARYGIPAHHLVRWDPAHPLQGHLVLRGAELVVIAPRTSDRRPVLLSDEEWNACCLSADERDRLLAA